MLGSTEESHIFQETVKRFLNPHWAKTWRITVVSIAIYSQHWFPSTSSQQVVILTVLPLFPGVNLGFVGEKTSGQTIFLASPNKNGAFWKTFLRTRPKWQVLNSLASFRVKGMAMTLRHRVYLSTSKNSHCSCHSRATQIKRRSLPNSVYTFLKQHIGYPNNGWLNDALLYFQAQKMIQATSFQEVRWFFYLSTITEIMRMMVVNNPLIRSAVSGGWHWGGGGYC